VACGGWFVVLLQEVGTQRLVVGDVEAGTVGEAAILDGAFSQGDLSGVSSTVGEHLDDFLWERVSLIGFVKQGLEWVPPFLGGKVRQQTQDILRLYHDLGILKFPISLLRKISRSSSEGIRFSSRFSWSVDDLEIELGQELGPTGLATVEELGRGEVF
jgi:hypothetical protein